jgi:hypothetical protein
MIGIEDRADGTESLDLVDLPGKVNNGHHSHRRRYSQFVTHKKEEPTSASVGSITMSQG